MIAQLVVLGLARLGLAWTFVHWSDFTWTQALLIVIMVGMGTPQRSDK